MLLRSESKVSKTSSKVKLLLAVSLLFVGQLTGQTNFVMGLPTASISTSKNIGNFLFVLDDNRNLYEIDLITQTHKVLSSDVALISFTTRGVYFTRYEQNQQRFLHYYEPGMSSSNFIQTSDSSGAYYQQEILIYGNQAVIGGYLNKKYVVFEFNGLSNTSRRTQGSSFKMIDAFELNGILAGVYLEYGYTVIRDQDQQIKFKEDTKNNWSRVVSNNHTLLFYVAGTMYLSHDLNDIDGNAYRSITDFYFLTGYFSSQGRVIGDSVIYGIKQNNYSIPESTYLLNLYPPYQLIETPIPSNLKKPIFKHISHSGKHHVIWTYELGIELAQLNPGDTLRLVADLNKGKGSSLSLQSQIYDIRDSAYFMATNGSGQMYFYRSADHWIESLFPSGAVSGITGIINNELYWYYYGNKTLSIYKRNLNNKSPEPTDNRYKVSSTLDGKQWHRCVYMDNLQTPYENYQFGFPGGKVLTDPDGNVVFSSSCTTPDGGDYSVISHSDTGYTKVFKGSPLISKFKANGELMWSNSIGGSSLYTFRNYAMASDENGNIYVSSVCFDSAWFDQIQSPSDRSIVYICKLNKDDGHVEWVKFTNPSYYSNDVYIHSMDVKKGQIYIGIESDLDRFNAFGELIFNNTFPFPLIMKLDTSGKHIFSKVVPSNLPNLINRIQSIKVQNNTDDVYLLVSQGEYNVFSSCEFNGFSNKILRMDRNGDFLNFNEFSGNDINLARNLLITGTGQVFATGYFRGSIQSRNLVLTSNYDPKTQCHVNEGYLAKFQLIGDNIKTSGLQKTGDQTFYPFDSKMDKEYLYLLGSERTNSSYPAFQMCILKMNHLGKLIAKRYLNINGMDPIGQYVFPEMTVSDSSFYINMGGTTRFSPYNNYPYDRAYASYFKFDKFRDWTPVADEFVEEYEEGQIILSPNPASDFVQIKLAEASAYKTWTIIDACGRQSDTGRFESADIHVLDIRSLAPGCYTLILEGADLRYIKLIAQ